MFNEAPEMFNKGFDEEENKTMNVEERSIDVEERERTQNF